MPRKETFGQLDMTKHNLHELRCEQWGELIFFSFDTNVEPLTQYLETFANQYQRIVATPLRTVSRKSFPIACNWKIAVEAFIEDYHLPSTHLRTAARIFEAGETRLRLQPKGHGTMFTHYKSTIPTALAWTTDMPDLLGPEFKDFAAVIGTFPNTLIAMQPFGYQTMTIWPLSINESRLDVVTYGPDWGEGALPDGWQSQLANFDLLVEEDLENLGPIQRSIEADATRGIPLSTQECRLWHFNAHIDLAIGAERIPEELRVPDLLRDFVEP